MVETLRVFVQPGGVFNALSRNSSEDIKLLDTTPRPMAPIEVQAPEEGRPIDEV